jgi:hypothetical protein
MAMDHLSSEAERVRNPKYAETLRTIHTICEARWALDWGDMETAAEVLEGVPPPPRTMPFTDGLLLQVLLSTAGALDTPSAEELEKDAEFLLAGTSLDLARIFLGKKDPVPGGMWPDRLWHPEWRLWLALWLEAGGDKGAAREIAEGARDPRYGLTYSQPAIESLLERL